MTLIEGVGDEVTDFFIVVGVLLIGWIAWCSTNISEQPLIRTVLILQHRTRTHIAELRANNQSSRTDSRSTNSEESSDESIAVSNDANNETEQTCPINSQEASQVTPEATNASNAVENTSSEEVLIQAMDSLNDGPNLHYRPVKLTTPESTTTSEASSVIPPDSVSESASCEDNEITIKLKFINDDQKLVTGRLKELLGDFKRRHFQVELDAQKRVRLVFNGHVLQPDSETLEKCGLYNNCVVHCLVHQPRLPPVSASQSNATDTSSIYSGPQSFANVSTGDTGISSLHNEWDLSRLLVSILTLILAFAWYSRYYYAQLFTATTTLALYALTAIFTLSVVGHFFPDQDNFREIE
ncbi:transmembrane and ubiquitin-like domain-containing protein 1 [Chelonus insularis]|uniref:transmembrane and ubiquitin-like domain-containing protein 1 n=1 Tax=Chelonus insularis TaxID=460826 RepID=UPI00158F422D|nr:transmembrane and ubiquitin-like domain-containing protein 1 [Chelonus insularis]